MRIGHQEAHHVDELYPDLARYQTESGAHTRRIISNTTLLDDSKVHGKSEDAKKHFVKRGTWSFALLLLPWSACLDPRII